ncbi:MAG: 16S rRNA (guanine(527)-N(7))-methyltransferase RsmG [Paludibacteraceae bacterium]|jgi:16S rRNA (guanine527-N7)-methyltransferase|nr:16S rRNA (guanine(527)-N(7))-methyltransferase RsmG [Paludibacteraceae bacterium]
MSSRTLLNKYFTLTSHQEQQFDALGELYPEWNSKINVISRKDIEFLYEHHILHSLSIAKLINFQPNTSLLDVGTGGGFPGIPLAIMFPQCQFTLIDSIGKKIRVASEIAHAIGLTNVTCIQERVEQEKNTFDFVVSRAVMPLPDLVKLVKKNISKQHQNAMPNGLITLKGGNLDSEIHNYRKVVEVTKISDLFEEEFFKEKQLVYLPL